MSPSKDKVPFFSLDSLKVSFSYCLRDFPHEEMYISLKLFLFVLPCLLLKLYLLGIKRFMWDKSSIMIEGKRRQDQALSQALQFILH